MIEPRSDTFRRWIPFDVLSKGPGETVVKIRGIASSESVDADGDVVVQDGIDWSLFKSQGFLTYEHPLGAANIVGEPREIRRTEVNGVNATEIEGVLYTSDGLGKMLADKAKAMQKAGGSRRLGFSVEGVVKLRDRDNPKLITQSAVRSVAITPVPKNSDSWFEPLAASMALLNALRQPGVSPEALMRAESIGYPKQGDAAQGTGGLEKLAVQSLAGTKGDGVKMPSKTYSASARDMATMIVLKKNPNWSWAQGQSVADAIIQKLNLKEYRG